MNKLNYHWDKFNFRLKRHFVEVLRTKTSDHSVALGFSLGSFIAILPTPGVSILIGLALIAIFKQINKLSLLVAMTIWNVWTLAPMYWLSYKIGNSIFGDAPMVKIEFSQLDQVFDYTLRFMVGNLLVSVPTAVLSYYLVIWGLSKIRARRAQKK